MGKLFDSIQKVRYKMNLIYTFCYLIYCRIACAEESDFLADVPTANEPSYQNKTNDTKFRSSNQLTNWDRERVIFDNNAFCPEK